MIYGTVGEVFNFPQTFFDSNGNPTTVTSATLTVVYPTATSSGALLWRDPGQQKAVATITMTQQADGSYLAQWDSSVSEAGQIFWSISGPAVGRIVSQGTLILRGNIASLQAFPPPPASLP